MSKPEHRSQAERYALAQAVMETLEENYGSEEIKEEARQQKFREYLELRKAA